MAIRRWIQLHLLVLGLFAVSTAGAQPLHIRRIATSGHRSVSEASLREGLRRLVPRGRLSVTRRRQVARSVRDACLKALRDRGHLGAAVTVTEFRPGLHVTFVILRAHIQEGPRYRVGALEVTGTDAPHRLRALSQVTLRSGQVLGLRGLRQSQAAVATVFADEGYAFAKVSVRRRLHAGAALVDLTFHVQRGVKVRIGQVQVSGVSRTAALLIRRALLLFQGSAYHRTTLVQALKRLRRTGAFRDIRLREEPLGKSGVKLIVTATERVEK